MNVEYLSCGLTALVCIYYFINAEKTWQKMVLSPCIAILGAEYITILYPAFQVRFRICLFWNCSMDGCKFMG